MVSARPPGFRGRPTPRELRSLGLRCSGLHPSPPAPRPVPLDILPLGPHERADLLTLSVVRAFVGKPTTMPSADFCAAIAALTGTLSPGIPDTAQTSRGKTDRLHRTPAESTAPALDGYGLRGCRPARPAGSASYPVLVHRVAVLLHASFRPRLATTPLRFANPSPPSGWIEDFHLQAVSHARHTYPVEPAARSRPCGRVSLAPPLASSLRAPLAKKAGPSVGEWALLPTYAHCPTRAHCANPAYGRVLHSADAPFRPGLARQRR